MSAGLPNHRPVENPPDRPFVEGNVTRIYAEDLLRIFQAIKDGTHDVLTGILRATEGVRIETTVARPTADATRRGHVWITRGGAGVADKLQICMKKSDDTYDWFDVVTPP